VSQPKRIQLRRTKGWRKPEGAIVVARPSRWGNWYVIRRNRVVTSRGFEAKGDRLVVVATDKWGHETGPHWGVWPNTDDGMRDARTFAVELYRRALDASYVDLDGEHRRRSYLDGLAGHDLACWCPLYQPCHADVLLELANGGTS
jgi:hypothetical protein